MAESSERRLQEHLHQHRFYTQKAPSSGHGIMDPETGEYIDQADLVAIRDDPELGQYSGHTSLVLIIEEKHAARPSCYIEDDQRQQLERIQAITGGKALIAIQWKSSHYPHEFYRLDELQDTGKHWKITDEQESHELEDVT